VRSFKPYLLGATAFAVVLTALAMNKDVATLIARFDVLVFVPIMTSVLISGNVHMPSDFGIYLGFFIQWFIVGIVVGALVWTVARKKTGTAT
jgi:putative effector of murein hydrolase LrgA (UPF0299 family)